MNQKRLIDLISRIENEQANQEEILELEEFYAQFDQRPGYTQQLDASQKIAYEELTYNRIHSNIQQVLKIKRLKSRRKSIIKYTVAASILCVLSIGIYIYSIHNSVNKPAGALVSPTAEIASTKNTPTLTLSNGKNISLDKASIGVLSDEQGVIIRKMADGLITYESGNKSSFNELGSNLITIPKGQTYQIVLPDGTKVWLNAVSSLRYPSVFKGGARSVELIGEGYFEVARNKQQPFIVKTAGQTIEVLGTHFNVNSYSDEKLTKTTLFEGRVRVTHQDRSVVLKPGQQATTAAQGAAVNVGTVELESVIAWRNGTILFENADIQSIMRHLTRKYDIEVEYRGEISNQKFGGAFQQSSSLKELLDYLESYGDVRFEIQGRRVIVMR